ncbi:MAG: amino acid/amide transporter substrate-binding protein family [Ramlibacter sp.]|nr:amino acid/amide transporter substrate-binding protein family [Ramlibacter sp.]
MSIPRPASYRSPVLPTRRRLLLRGAAAASIGISIFSRPARAATAVTDGAIRLGQSIAQSGPLGGVAREFTEAAIAMFDLVNTQGGIRGRRIELIAKDDGYVPDRTAANVSEWIANKEILALFGVLGVANSAVALPLAAQARMPFLFPTNGDPSIRRQPNRYLFTATGSFDDEIDRLVAHANTIGAKRISVAHLSVPFGKSILEATSRATKARGQALHSSAAFDLEGDKSQAAKVIAASRPDAVILGAVGNNAAEFIHAFRATGSTALMLTCSVVGTDLVFKKLGAESAGLVIAQIVPYPWNSATPIVKDYQALCKGRGVTNFSHIGLWGHIAARITVEALKRAGRDITGESLIRALEGMRNIDLGHYIVDFSPTKHHGSHYSEITLLAPDGRLVK